MLMRFDPFRELDRITQAVDRPQLPQLPLLAMDAYRHGEEFIVLFDLPGARADSIALSVEKNVLTVRADRSAATATATRSWSLSARRAVSADSCS
jgi:HSP20 family protein